MELSEDFPKMEIWWNGPSIMKEDVMDYPRNGRENNW
jgi:hypothetical protein